ncbi:MAG: aldo/keto reductase [Asgard group archaeon]|nr:aldo/keto reductase [Asgard group archaeon]
MKLIKLPKIGLGTMMANSKKARQGLIKGFEIGFRFLDTAQMYLNERNVGNAIKESRIPRDEFIVATKLFVQNFSPRRVLKTTEKSLKRLGLETIDVLYLHWPARFKIIDKTLEAMNKLVKQEKIQHIAVSNYTTGHLDKALSSSESHIIANQVEMHPWLQQRELLAHHLKKKVHVVSYFPLMHGRFKQVPELMQIAEKHQVSGAQISLAWIISKGAIPIPKSINPLHLKDNFDSQKLKLDKEDIDLIDNIQKQKRFLSPPIVAPKWNKKYE